MVILIFVLHACMKHGWVLYDVWQHTKHNTKGAWRNAFAFKVQATMLSYRIIITTTQALRDGQHRHPRAWYKPLMALTIIVFYFVYDFVSDFESVTDSNSVSDLCISNSFLLNRKSGSAPRVLKFREFPSKYSSLENQFSELLRQKLEIVLIWCTAHLPSFIDSRLTGIVIDVSMQNSITSMLSCLLF